MKTSHSKFCSAAFFALLASTALRAQATYATPYTFTTLAGTPSNNSTDLASYADGTGGAAKFLYPNGVAADGAGNVYVADSGNSVIRKITGGGIVTTLAGKAGATGSVEGTGSAARFIRPSGVAVDSAGNIYVADEGANTIRKITNGGVVTTLAGKAGSFGTIDGTGTDARFNFPTGVAVDSAGNVYVSDVYSTIRKIASDGVVTTLAGKAGTYGSVDGIGSAARFNYLNGIAVDGAGNVYVSDLNWDDDWGDLIGASIRKVTSDGVVTTLAGSAGATGSNDGTGSAARFTYLFGVAVDGGGNVFVVDSDNSTIRKVTSSGVVSTLAGAPIPSKGGWTDGTGNAVRFSYPEGIAVDVAGKIYVTDNNMIRKGFDARLPIVIVQQPIGQTITSGTYVVLTAAASGTFPIAYQWYHNSAAVPGATSATLALNRANQNDSGSYWVVATNAFGSETSYAATMTIADPGAVAGYLRALSIRGGVGTGADALFLGFAIEGSGGSVLVKAIGPGIAAAPFSVPGALSDPRLEFAIAGTQRSNDNWGGADEIRSADGATGSFPLADAASRDAAMLLHLDRGVYSGTVSGAANTTGVALVEFYGLDAPSNLKALSLRGRIGAGANAFFVGFIIDGSTSRTVLIKAVGPGLAAAPFNIPGALADPMIELLQAQNGQTISIGGNDNWGGTSDLAAANLAAGAFPLNDPGSRDAAMLITLPPGIYIVKASGVNDTTGIGLVEIYGM